MHVFDCQSVGVAIKNSRYITHAWVFVDVLKLLLVYNLSLSEDCFRSLT